MAYCKNLYPVGHHSVGDSIFVGEYFADFFARFVECSLTGFWELFDLERSGHDSSCHPLTGTPREFGKIRQNLYNFGGGVLGPLEPHLESC